MQLVGSGTQSMLAPASAADLIGTAVVRATFAWNDGSTRDIVARHVIGTRAGYESIDDALRGARLHQRHSPSPQWPHQAIAIVRDDTSAGYRLLQLDQRLSAWEAGVWWQASSFTALAPAVEVRVNGRGQLVDRDPDPA
jgi:hypothetical protein